jgi:hypothetical protein
MTYQPVPGRTDHRLDVVAKERMRSFIGKSTERGVPVIINHSRHVRIESSARMILIDNAWSCMTGNCAKSKKVRKTGYSSRSEEETAISPLAGASEQAGGEPPLAEV